MVCDVDVLGKDSANLIRLSPNCFVLRFKSSSFMQDSFTFHQSKIKNHKSKIDSACLMSSAIILRLLFSMKKLGPASAGRMERPFSHENNIPGRVFCR